ncbi:hypothetical protein [Sphingomonas sp. LH128]|uniref:hypothetical protein n=1 Tax=Sphingomonas sp. LH128 TaxID=473781 RepID=UPI00155DF622|nr:hypothetical protein [Sphingomonas sp. LH128]
MRGTNSIIARAAISTALAAILAGPVGAQSSGTTWSLPEPTATPSSRAQGPVDAQNPLLRPRNAAPEPVPTIAAPPPQVQPSAQPPRVQPTAQPSVTPRSTPTRTPNPAASPSAPEPRASATPEPQGTPSASAPVAPEPLPTPIPAPSAVETPTTAPAPAPAPLAPASQQGLPIWVWAIPAALVVLGALAFFLRRKRPAEEAEDWPEVQEVAEPVAPPVPKPAPVPQPEFASPPVSPRPAPVPPPAAAPEAVDIAFEPVGLRLSLVFATLQYRVTLTAGTDLPAGHLIGDMIGAHGSLTSEQQLAPPLETLTPLKPVPALAARESVTLTGEVQLPLSAIRPLQRANASFFVPLLRVGVVFAETVAPVRRVFTLGIAGGPALAPLRLDTGPMEHRDLGAREVPEARAYPVLPGTLRKAV